MTKVEIKAKKYASKYVANKFNGRKTALELYNTTDPHVADAIASENLRKPVFRDAILAEMEEHGINDEEISKAHKFLLTQRNNYPVIMSSIQEYHKLRGNYAPEEKRSINLNVSGEQLDKLLQDKLQELKALTENND